MADDEKTTVEAGGAEGGETGGKKPNIILLGGIGVGAIVIGIVLALFVIGPMMGGSDGGGEEEAAVEESSSHGASSSGHGEAESSHKPKKKSSHGGGESGSFVYAVRDIVINPAGTGGSRFLSASVGFEFADSDLEGAFEDKEPMVRDALITILSSKTVAQLTDVKQKEIVRWQIKKRVATIMGTDEITGVYFTDFVLQ